MAHTPTQRRLVLRTVEGQYGINGIVEMPVAASIKNTAGTFKLERVTPTYVLYLEQPRAVAA